MISNRFVYPRLIVDVLADVWVEDTLELSVKVFSLAVCADAVINMLFGVYVDLTIDVASDIGVGVLTDVNDSVLVAAMTVLSFTMPVP